MPSSRRTSRWIEFRRGDIALRVPPEEYGDATVALEGLDLD